MPSCGAAAVDRPADERADSGADDDPDRAVGAAAVDSAARIASGLATLDPDNRSLLRVEVAQADVADEIFTRPMGDVVEPRREFIQENALNVANLDV